MLQVPNLANDSSSEASLEMGSVRRLQPPDDQSKHFERLHEGFNEFQPMALCCLARDDKPRVWFIKLMCWPWFERISILVILTNCVTLGMYDPFDKECETHGCKVLETMETCIYAFFLVEMLVKWLAMGLFGKQGYFADSWNKLDCFIVAAGTFELAYGEGEYLSAVRSIRVLRPLRAINRVPSIRILVMLLLDTLPMLGNVLAICFFIFAIFGIIGVQLWQGILRNRCFPDELNSTTVSEYNLSNFYRPSFTDPDYVCSLPNDAGLSKCQQQYFTRSMLNDVECNGTFPLINQNSSCVNWNQYYTTCRKSAENIYYGSISFDNIAIATVAIFQIITLEGWTDIMYKIQDAHSFWNWWYFVVLILLGSYFMTNLCLVVITSQFQETKQRETDLLKQSRLRSRASISTVSSSFMQQGCYAQILQYLEHLARRFKRRILKLDKTSKRKKVNPCLQLRGRRDHVKSVHHHHHHYHYYHHFVHHPSCQCSNLEHSDSPPASANGNGEHPYEVTQDNEGTKIDKEGKRVLVVPQIQVFAQAATAIYKDAGADSSADMVSTATANINVGGLGSTASILTYSKTADSVSMAAQTTTETIKAACSCAVEQKEDERQHREKERCSSLSEDNEGHEVKSKKPRCYVRFRKITKVCVETTWFNRFIMISIFLNTICMAVEHHGQPAKMDEAFRMLNIIFTFIFAVEMLAKIFAFGPYGYIKDAFNLFDGIIVILSVMDVFADNNDSGISVLRSFRLLRIFKLVRFMPALQRQLRVMIRTLDNVMTFLALLSLFIFTASILGMHLFGAKYSFPNEEGKMVSARGNFDSLFWALVTVFQILTQEDWNVVLYDGMRSTSPWASLYFLFLMIIGNYILFNLLVAILVEGFADQTENESMMLNSEKKRTGSNVAMQKKQFEHDGRLKEQCNQNIALSWPNIITKIKDEYQHKSIVRSNSVPGCPTTKSGKCEQSSSYLHVLTVDTLDSEKMIKERYGKRRCGSLVNEDTYLVPIIDIIQRNGKKTTTTQKNSWFEQRKLWSLYLFSPTNRFRKFFIRLHSNVWFDRIVLFFILLNCVVMAIEEPGMDPQSKTMKFIDIMQYIFTAIFTIEMSIKVISLGLFVGRHTYLRSGWNVIDGILVLFSLIDLVVSLVTHSDNSILGVLRVFRAFRTLRPLRVINRAPELKLVVETLLSSLKPIGNVVLIAATFFTIFGILGVQLFSGKFYTCNGIRNAQDIRNKTECLLNQGTWINNEYNFDNLARALLTLFVFATRDGWVAIMYSGVDVVGVDQQPQRNHSKWNVLYFVAFLLLAGFVVLNMLVGVVVENFHKCRDKLLKEQNLKSLGKTSSKGSRNSDSFDTVDYETFTAARKRIHHFVTHDYFDLTISIVICINILFMGLEHYNQPENLTLFLKYANYVFTVLFILEAALKIVALGLKNYFRNKWNCMDMIIVVLSIGGIILDELATSHLPMNPTIIRVMRVLRITRVLKLLKTAEGIRSLLDTVGSALPQVANLGMLFILLFFIFGALGMELFGEISCENVECEGLDSHAHFKNFGYSVLTLFRVATGDNWNGILKDTINSKRCESNSIDACQIIQHIAPIYFATFVLITQFVLLNVVVAVMMKHLEEAKFLDFEGEFVSNRDRISKSLALKGAADQKLQGTPKLSKSALKVVPLKNGQRLDESDNEHSQNWDKENNLEKFEIISTVPKNVTLVSELESVASEEYTFEQDNARLEKPEESKTDMKALDVNKSLAKHQVDKFSPKNKHSGDNLSGDNVAQLRSVKDNKVNVIVSEVHRRQEDTVEDIRKPRRHFKVRQGWSLDEGDNGGNEKQGEREIQNQERGVKRHRRKNRQIGKDVVQELKKEDVEDREGQRDNVTHSPKEGWGPTKGWHDSKNGGGLKEENGVHRLKEDSDVKEENGSKEGPGSKQRYKENEGHNLKEGNGPKDGRGPKESDELNHDHDLKKEQRPKKDRRPKEGRELKDHRDLKEEAPEESHELEVGHGPNEGREPKESRDPNDGHSLKREKGTNDVFDPIGLGEKGTIENHGKKEQLKEVQVEDETQGKNEELEEKERATKKNKKKLKQQKEKTEQEHNELTKTKVQVLPPLGGEEEQKERQGPEGTVEQNHRDRLQNEEGGDLNEKDIGNNAKQRRIQFHGIRLEPLPNTITKLSQP